MQSDAQRIENTETAAATPSPTITVCRASARVPNAAIVVIA